MALPTKVARGLTGHWQALASAAVILIGGLALLGWALNVPVLTSVLPDLASMKANTALAFVLVGIALWLLRAESGRRLAQICALAVFLIGLLTLAEYLFGWNPGFDQWLFRDPGGSGGLFPGRMAEATALSFVLLGLALWLTSRDLYFALAQFCGLLVAGIALFALAGYLYDVVDLYRFSLFASIALNTAFLFLISAVCLIPMRPQRGFVAVISADTPGGFMARRLLPLVMVVPLILGWLGLTGERLGLYGDQMDHALTILAIIVLFAPLIWLNARMLNRIDAERKGGAERIRRLNRTLAVLSDINQAIVRIRDVPMLFEKVAQIAVETGEFRAVWIGLIDPATQVVTLAAHGGLPDEFLKALKRMEGLPAKNVPVLADLLRGADHVVFSDMQNDPQLEATARAAAQALGYRSLTLLPLRVSGQLRGVISLAAEEANFFDDQELRLLDELAADAAFAMEFAEQEAQRRQAESALREANETLEQRVAERTAELRAQQRQLRYFASLQEAVSDAVISTDLGFRIQSWNAAAERIYGWRADEVIGQRSPDLFKTEFAPGDSSEHILKEFQAHGFWTAEVVQRHKDGHAIPILGSMTLIKDAGDTAMGIVAVNHDITSWKQAEAALRESEARYRLLADHVSDLIARIDTMGVYVYISPSSQTMLGYTPEELVGKSGLELIHPDDVGEVIQQMQVALDPNGHVSPVTYRMLHKDGHYVWVETNGQIVWSEDRSEIIGFITMSRDVSERKRAEDALALSEQRFSLLVNGVRDYAIFVLDTEGRVLSWNPGAERIKGYSAGEIIGQNFARFYVPEEIVQGQPQVVLRTAEREGHYVGEGWRVRKDGSRFWAEVVVTALRDSGNRLIGFTKITRDLTERKLAEESLQQALERERELGELKSRFVSMASHEFRTPLATILAAAETLSAYRQKMTEPQIDHRIDNIREQVTHLKNIIEDVLQLARIQAGRLEFNPVTFDLDAMCRSVIDEFQSQPDVRHVLDYHCDDGLKAVKLDKKLMRQMINNLVSNAIKYSPGAEAVFIRLAISDGALILSVRDQGIGIPEADLKHLFEPFHRASNVGAISGTGLGLSITKEAVELHGGTIQVDSEVGVGTTFVITIPVSSENEHDQNSDH